jgi:hypothetical protein
VNGTGVNTRRGLHDRLRGVYAAGCFEDLGDGVEDGDILGNFIDFASDGRGMKSSAERKSPEV